MDAFFFRPDQYDSGETPTDTAWSDRLYQQDSKKYDELRMKHFGDNSQYWAGADPKKVEVFLSQFIGKPIHLCTIKQYENKSSGYPYWEFGFYYMEIISGL